MAVQIGNLMNLSQLGSHLSIARETLERYIFVLENTFVVKTLPPFFTNRTKELVKMKKVFFYDLGLRNFSISDFKELELRLDKGALAENGVAGELIKRISVLQNLHFWRTQAKTEVDFILMDGNDITPIEVKYQRWRSPKVPSGLKVFIENYKPQKAYVFTKDFSDRIDYSHCQVQFLPIFMSSLIF